MLVVFQATGTDSRIPTGACIGRAAASTRKSQLGSVGDRSPPYAHDPWLASEGLVRSGSAAPDAHHESQPMPSPSRSKS